MILLGDFNLDEKLKFNPEYSHAAYYNELNSTINSYGLVQLVTFNTWERIVNNTLKQSILDHIYVNDSTIVTDVTSNDTLMTDCS